MMVEEGGGSWYFPHSCELCNEGGGRKKNTPNNKGGFQKMQGKKSKITIASLYINYEPSHSTLTGSPVLTDHNFFV